ncbi:nuclear transport factor 2 family protein [Flavobacterium sp. ZT3R25]|uniref:nuclear transport factor 2 family protein n=1 Tax=Flavobacterium galactosi TaxID=3398735 RepID=UPI003A89C712
MTKNKQTIQKYMEAFMASDHEKILSCLIEDVTWEVPGMFRLSGKEAFDKEIENDNFIGSPTIQIIRMTEENNIVIAEGAVQCKIKNGNLLDAVFCDVFHMQNEKIKHLTSYLMNKSNSTSTL